MYFKPLTHLRNHAALAVVVFVLQISALSQTARESFVYQPGVPLLGLEGGQGWRWPWEGNGSSWVTTSQGLSFEGFPSSGGAIALPESGSGGNLRYFTTAIGGAGKTTYFAWLVHMAESTDYARATVMLGPSPGISVALWDNGGQRTLDIVTGMEFESLPVGPATAQTYLVTGFLAIDAAGVLNMQCSLWTEPSAPLVSTSRTSNDNYSDGFSGVSIGGRGDVALDELYFGPTPLVAEFGTLAQLTGLLTVAGVCGARRYRNGRGLSKRG